ncbi:MAG TPA: anti-sigma factor, partial [Sandaracinaceae bacterium]
MDCEACTDRLVDLLEGELDAAEAEPARAHLAECESCAAAFARLERGRELATMLVLEEPPASVRNAVLAAARERAMARAPVRVPDSVERPASEPREPRHDREDEDGGLWASFLRWLGSLAMGPQVAMAMMLLLMIGIGLWYLPGLRSRPAGDAHAILDPAPGDEAGPSQGLQPAAPLDLEADPRTGRIRPRDEHPARPPRPAPRTPPATEIAATRRVDDREERAEAESPTEA